MVLKDKWRWDLDTSDALHAQRDTVGAGGCEGPGGGEIGTKIEWLNWIKSGIDK